MKREIREVPYSVFKLVHPGGREQLLHSKAEIRQWRLEFLEKSEKGPYGEPTDQWPDIFEITRSRRVLVFIGDPKQFKFYEVLVSPAKN